MKRVTYIAVFLILMFTSELLTGQSLSFLLKDKIKQSGADQSIWSFSVRDTAGNELFSYNSNQLITPASNLKLISTAAYFHYLGENFTYETKIYGRGELRNSTWFGDLIIVGSGDPSIGGELYSDNKWFAFDTLITTLKDFGIERVEGHLIGNDGLFDSEPYPKGWDLDDLSFYYAVETNALSFNRNTVELVVTANGKTGDIPDIEWFPFNTDYVNFVNEQQITPKNTSYQEYYKRFPGTNTIFLKSNLPKGYVEEEALSVANASMYFIDTFKKYAEYRGMVMNVRLTIEHDIFEKENHILLASHRSEPLGKMISRINKDSDNFYAEMLLKTMAAAINQTQGTTEQGVNLLKSYLAEIGIDSTKVYFFDSSGLSMYNLITTSHFTQLLQKITSYSWFNTYLSTLSIAGIDGSLNNRFLDSPVQSKFYGKTGYTSGTRALSGYLLTRRGNRLSVSMATNHYIVKTKEIDAIHEWFLNWLHVNL